MPQGSILGPILFIFYINDMHTVSSLMKCIIFADDTNFLYTGNDISEMCKTVSKELDKLSSWFTANKLSLNISKTNFMVISRRQIVNNPIVSINSITIERVYITWISYHSTYLLLYIVFHTCMFIIIIIYLFYIALNPCTVLSASQLKGVTLHH